MIPSNGGFSLLKLYRNDKKNKYWFMDTKVRQKSNRNQTIEIHEAEKKELLNKCIIINSNQNVESVLNKIINQDLFYCIDFLPDKSIDLAVIDPPYNLNKDFNTIKFKVSDDESFYEYTKKWVKAIKPKLKKTASIYICCDWKSTSSIYRALAEEFIVQNRITWQREKGRGAKSNWKNCIEDIWFCTVSNDYYFDVDSVKQKRKVIAPYRVDGVAKDWEEEEGGEKYRLTCPSNFWDDISIPFWSMPENTTHPTQKPEKLISKLILASSKTNDVVLDCFLGSGTTAVVAKKLKRNFVGIEIDPYYAAISQKRLTMADNNNQIQGYENGVFLERNTAIKSNKSTKNIINYAQPILI